MKTFIEKELCPSTSKGATQKSTFWKDPLIWLTLFGFGLPFVVQLSFYPLQKLSMFSEDPSAYIDMPARVLKK